MKEYTVYDPGTGKIKRSGVCTERTFLRQPGKKHPELSVIEGRGNDRTQKVVGGKIVDKTPAEIDRDNPSPAVPPGERMVHVTQKDWDALHARLDALENKP